VNPAAIALASSLSWGASDFLGGVAAKRISPYQAVVLAHIFSLACLIATLRLLHLHSASHGTMIFGLIAGFFGGGGLILFYKALSQGEMGVTAALGGVLSAAVPVVCSLLTEGLPQIHQLLGFAVAVAAIWMIAATATPARGASVQSSGFDKANRRSLWLGGIAGTCFGIYFVLLKHAVSSTGLPGAERGVLASVLWSITFSRVTSSILALFICAWMAISGRSEKSEKSGLWRWQTLSLCAAIGLLDMGGNLLYTLAARLGRMDIAAVLSSLYPAVTIVLAVWILKERTSRVQTFGMALALAAVALISV
jgi:drug/metabolite transporter (DMT)-like permease